jgi:hypothetical protein
MSVSGELLDGRALPSIHKLDAMNHVLAAESEWIVRRAFGLDASDERMWSTLDFASGRALEDAASMAPRWSRDLKSQGVEDVFAVWSTHLSSASTRTEALDAIVALYAAK